jgi:hypothetical protein
MKIQSSVTVGDPSGALRVSDACAPRSSLQEVNFVNWYNTFTKLMLQKQNQHCTCSGLKLGFRSLDEGTLRIPVIGRHEKPR